MIAMPRRGTAAARAVTVCALVSTGLLSIAAAPSDEAMIRAARARSNAAVAAHDVEGVVGAMTPDCVALSSTNIRTVGREAARANYADIFKARPDVNFVRTPRTIEVNAAWGHAAEQGTWTGRWTAPDGPVRVAGSYFAKWVKTDGVWRIAAETFVQTSCAGGSYCTAPPGAPR
jgi:uncharacterized protein (TIGR02246 family)